MLDIDKLETTLVDLSQISNAIKNNVAKNNGFVELIKKDNAI